ncbi:MAG TPA: hypothetical protein VFW38_08070 [Solirubrobacteraceae bacterium]|nr:hypothetical protein [Solirubrobacteraceae bacterium]
MLVEGVREYLAVLGDGAAQTEGVLGLECRAPDRLVEVVDPDGLFGCL